MKRLSFLLVFIILALIVGLVYLTSQFVKRAGEVTPTVTFTPTATITPTPFPKTKVAFVGDISTSDDAKQVVNLIKTEKADIFVAAGDLGYDESNPKAAENWYKMVDSALPSTTSLIVAIGNHDVSHWSNYSKLISDRLVKSTEIKCSGDLGVNQECKISNINFMLSGIGTYGSNHIQYADDVLKNVQGWKICVWHKNQRLMQVGGKTDEVGWEMYDLCRKYGAIIITGHEHSYERTKLMTDFAKQQFIDESKNLDLKPGQTFAVVSGLGGESVRLTQNGLGKNPWWAKIYTKDVGDAKPAVLFCDFLQVKASCYLKNIKQEVIDMFEVNL